jgi:hypothetical protein
MSASEVDGTPIDSQIEALPHTAEAGDRAPAHVGNRASADPRLVPRDDRSSSAAGVSQVRAETGRWYVESSSRSAPQPSGCAAAAWHGTR